ncbi:4Fe-4S binding protein [Dehalococcoidia bacterium]|nr:4Fe-4S binding protein [Dehalococcoidia bacterium]
MVKRKITSRYEAAWSNSEGPLLSLDTGTWRTRRPVVDKEKCTYCGLCALYCPPQCMIDLKDHFVPNLDFCKGCGICVKECPPGAATMVPEGEFHRAGIKG